MRVERYELRPTGDEFTLIIHLDQGLYEFGDEFQRNTFKKKEEYNQFLRKLVHENFPNLKIVTVKVMVGSLIVSSLYVSPSRTFANAIQDEYQVESTIKHDLYTVQQGDSLSVIAKKFDISVDLLKDTNGLKSDLIFVGQQLQLPFYSYAVVKGDTISLIAKRFQVSQEDLITYNRLQGDTIYSGQILRIPVNHIEEVTTNEEVVEPVVKENSTTYIVLSGDSLSVIAKRYGVTVNDIKALNGMESDRIFVGQKLLIPQPITEEPRIEEETVEDIIPVTYTVVSGDSLSVIAKHYSVTVNDIISLNGMESDRIFVGQTLYIPQVIEEETGVIVDETTPEENVTVTYTVVSGDSLWTIANRFGVTVTDIQSMNGLTTDRIFIGQTLRIPQKNIVEEKIVEPEFLYFEPVNQQNETTYHINGKAGSDMIVSLTFTDTKGENVKEELRSGLNGVFTGTLNLQSLDDGDILLTAYTMNDEGNKSEEISATILKETQIDIPLIETSGYVNSESQFNYLFYGTGKKDAAVTISIEDESGNRVEEDTITQANGEFVLPIDLSRLNDSLLTVNIHQKDRVGNVSEQKFLSIRKDTGIPAIPIVKELPIINNQNETRFSVAGLAEPNAKLTLKVVQNGQTIKNISGTTIENGEFDLQMDASELEDGEYTFEITQQDEAGNMSEVVQIVTEKITTTPEIIVKDIPVINSANDGDFTVSGTTEPDSIVEVSISDGLTTLYSDSLSDVDGNFLIPFNVHSLKDGTITVLIETINPSGNRSEEFEQQIQKDTLAPIELTVHDLNAIHSTNQTEYSISGESAEDNTVLLLEATDGINVVVAEMNTNQGPFEFRVDVSELEDGPIHFTLIQEDQFLNRTDPVTYTVEKDTNVISPEIFHNGYIIENEQIFYTVRGIVEPLSTILITVHNNDGEVIFSESRMASETGHFNVLFNGDEFGNGEQLSYSINQTDQFGNTSEFVQPTPLSYKVVSGDTLSQIARRYNTTVAAIKTVNRITSDVIYIDQMLRLPMTASERVNLGYLYFGDPKQFTEQVTRTEQSMNVVSPSYFDINTDGTLKLTYQVDRNFVSNMHAMGIRVVPFLSNHWDRSLGRAMLANPEQSVQQIAQAIQQYNLDGINVDIENINDQDREQFTNFVRLLRETLPPSKEVSVAVAANPNGWTTGWHGAYDYTELAKYADYLMLMTYDESYPGSSPGSVASFNWVERSIQYAISKGVGRDQIVVGLPHYGRYWIEGQTSGGYGISNVQIESMFKIHEHIVTYDESSQSAKATVTIKDTDPKTYILGTALKPGTYTIWYENEQALKAKASLVQKYNLRGLGHWSIGQEETSVWNTYPTWTNQSNVIEVGHNYNAEQNEDVQLYTVEAGDSLYLLAKQFGTTIDALKESNQLAGDTVYIGQILTIPTK